MAVYISCYGIEKQIEYIREELHYIHQLLDSLNTVHSLTDYDPGIYRCIKKMEAVKKSIEWRKQFLEEMVLKEIPKLMDELENDFKGTS